MTTALETQRGLSTVSFVWSGVNARRFLWCDVVLNMFSLESSYLTFNREVSGRMCVREHEFECEKKWGRGSARERTEEEIKRERKGSIVHPLNNRRQCLAKGPYQQTSNT